MKRLTKLCLLVLLLASAAAPLRADIFQWEYINPANPALGKQQSTTLCVDGAGQNAAPYGDIFGNLSMAYLIGADLRNSYAESVNLTDADLSQANLTGVSFYSAILSNANLSQANLTSAYFYEANLANANLSQANLGGAGFNTATLTGADFSDADVRGAYFGYYLTGFTAAQLYSTASYQAHDLTGIGFENSDLSGWNFAGQNLTGASFAYTSLTGADFTGADVRGTSFGGNAITPAQLYSTASYQAHDLTGIGFENSDLSGWNFAGQNLTNAGFTYATLTGVDFTNAIVRGVQFSNAITLAQLYGTGSYQMHDLRDIGVSGADLTGANLVGQNLTNASFSGAKLIGADLRQAIVADASFDFAILDNANLSQSDLANGNFKYAHLTNANLTQANLTGAYFYWSVLTGADLTGAEVRGANFTLNPNGGGGLSLAQLYSTASYQAHDLTGIGLVFHYLFGANFADQNLASALFEAAYVTNANFTQANLSDANFALGMLAGANFAGAEVRGANFGRDPFTANGGTGITPAQLASTASYQAHDLTGINLDHNNLTGANLTGQNLTDANFVGTTLSGANLTGAVVRGTNFDRFYSGGSGITLAQLYSTASYQAHDLTGINLDYNNLTGANLTGQNLTNAHLVRATLTGANFTGAQVQGANFFRDSYGGTGLTLVQLSSTASYHAHDLTGIGLGSNDLSGGNFAGQNLTNANLIDANLTGTNLSGADVRGALGLSLSGSEITTNLIRPDGHIAGLDLGAGEQLAVRDYNGNPTAYPAPTGPIAVTVEQHFAMDASGMLRMVFEADAWDSEISFAAGIPVTLGGTLELAFAEGVSLPSQIGRTFDVFNWTGVSPTGSFAVSSPYVWDLSKLYTTGDVTFLAAAGLPGDFNNDNAVDGADYVVWRKGLNTATYAQAAYNVWRGNFGAPLGAGGGSALPSAEPLSPAVPEPATAVLLSFGLVAMVVTRRARPTPGGGVRIN